MDRKDIDVNANSKGFFCVLSKTVFSLKKECLCNITFFSQSISSRCSYAEVRPKTHESCIIGFMISNIVTKMKYQS